MSASAMVAAVNRVIGNSLAGGTGVFLPGVGSLYPERQGARQLSKRSVQPPCRVIAFTSEQQGVSVVDEIARAAQCDTVKAQEIYERWLSRTQESETLTIEGVGVLKFKYFTLDPAFDKRLNPQGHKPVRVKSARVDWVLWMGIFAIAFVVASPAVVWWMDYHGLRPQETIEEQVSEVQKTSPGSSDADPAFGDEYARTEAGTQPVAPSESGVQAPSGQSADGPTDGVNAVTPATKTPSESPSVSKPTPPISAGTPEAPAAPAAFVSGQRYVVLGVFSTPENAARAAEEAVKKDASMRCGVYRFGAKFLVSPFQSADAEACTDFIRSAAATFPGMWTYTAK